MMIISALALMVCVTRCPAFDLRFLLAPSQEYSQYPEGHVCQTSLPCRDVGYCVPEAVGGGFRCRCFDEYYTRQYNCSEDALLLRDQCTGGGCLASRGVCKQLWGGTFCQCLGAFHGLDCAIDAPVGKEIKRSGMPIFLFNVDGETTRKRTFILTFDPPKLGEDILVEFSAGDGVMTRFTADDFKERVPADLKKHLFLRFLQDLLPTNKAPVLVFSHVYYMKDQDVHLTMRMLNKGVQQWGQSYQIHTRRMVRYCIPDVVLIECGENSARPPLARRFSAHTVHPYVAPDCKEFQSEVLFKWSAYKLSSDLYRIEKALVPYPVKNNIFYMSPYSVPLGIITIQLNVTENVKSSNKSSHYNVGKCWLHFAAERLVAIISEGYSVSKEEGKPFTVNASASYDPNMPLDRQDHLKFEWSCQGEEFESCEGLNNYKFKGPIQTFPGGKALTDLIFGLRLSVDPEKVPDEISADIPPPVTQQLLIQFVRSTVPILHIRCKSNCKASAQANPKAVTYLVAECKQSCINVTYTWEIRIMDQTTLTDDPGINWETAVQHQNPTDKLIVNANVLEPDSVYLFLVVGDNGQGATGAASLLVPVKGLPFVRGCDVEPTSGYANSTLFKLQCYYPEEDSWPLRYEFYQTNERDTDEFGVLVYYSDYHNRATDVSLLPGRKENDYETWINVKVTNYEGSYTIYQSSVQVKPLSNSSQVLRSFVSDSRKTIENLKDEGNWAGVVRLFGNVAHVLTTFEFDKSTDAQFIEENRINLLDYLQMVPISTIPAVRQVASALYKLISSVHQLESRVMYISSNVITDVSGYLYTRVDLNDDSTRVVLDEVVNCSRTLLRTISVMINIPGEYKEMANPVRNETLEDLDYPPYDYLDNTLVTARVEYDAVLKNVIAGIHMMANAVSLLLLERQRAIQINADNIYMWIKVDRPLNLRGEEIGTDKNGSFVKLSDKFLQKIEKSIPVAGFHVTAVKQQGYWWHEGRQTINVDTLIVSIVDEEGISFSGDLPDNMDLYLQIHSDTYAAATSSVVEGKMEFPFDVSQEEMEKRFGVHRIDSTVGDSLFIAFHGVSVPNCTLKVVTWFDKRPQLEDFANSKSSIHFTDGNEVQTIHSTTRADEEASWFYLGLLPDEDTIKAVQKTGAEIFSMEYTFQAFSARCERWSNELNQWTTEDCELGNETTTETLHCQCSHLSVFSGSFKQAPSKSDVFVDVDVILDPTPDDTFLFFLIPILFLLLLLLLLALLLDVCDRKKCRIILLPDNMPGFEYMYVLTVFTGGFLQPRCSANIGIQLCGTRFKCLPHILRDPENLAFGSGSEDWFILYTKKCLGDLIIIRLWHDNSGNYPDWHVNRIIVRDFQRNLAWTFLFHKWYSLVKGERELYYCITAAEKETLFTKEHLILENYFFSISEHHTWLSPLLRHPRNSYTRFHRVAVLSLCVVLIMLFVMLLFGVSSSSPADYLYAGSFEFTGYMVLAALIAALLVIPFTFFISLLFRKTKPRRQYEMRIVGYYTEPTEEVVKGKKGEEPLELTIYTFPGQIKSLTTPKRNFLSVLHGDPLFFLYVDDEPDDVPLPQVDADHGVQARRSTVLPVFEDRPKERAELTDERKLPYYVFPVFCSLIAWTLWLCLTVVGIFFLVWFGLKFGETKTYMWIATVLLAILIHAYFLLPLYVLIIALSLALCFKTEPKYYDWVGSIAIYLDLRYPRDPEELANHIHYIRLLWQHKMYKPIPPDELEKMRDNAVTCAVLLEALQDFLMFLLFLIFIYLVAFSTRSQDAYLHKKSHVDMFYDCFYEPPNNLTFRNVMDDQRFTKYLENTFIPTLHNLNYYNDMPLEEVAFTADLNAKLIGVARLRQIRVKKESCIIPEDSPDPQADCYQSYSMSLEDRKDYTLYWGSVLTNEPSDPRIKSPWKYMYAADAKGLAVLGVFGYYPAGGYVATLGRTRENSLQVLKFLTDFHWIDSLTRAVFLEFTTYNANANMFTTVILVAERTAFGMYVTKSYIEPMKLMLLPEIFNTLLIVAVVVLSIMLLIFTCRLVRAFQWTYWGSYSSTSWNIIDIFIIIMGVLTIIFFILRDAYILVLLKTLEDSYYNEFVSFFDAYFFNMFFIVVISLLVCFATARLLKIFMFSRKICTFTSTYTAAQFYLALLFFIYLALIFGLASFFYQILLHQLIDFSTAIKAFFTLLTFSILSTENMSYDMLSSSFPFVALLIYAVYWLVVFITLFTFMALMVTHYRLIKQQLSFKRKFTNMQQFIRNSIGNIPGPWRGNTANEERLRGGADASDSDVDKIDEKEGDRRKAERQSVLVNRKLEVMRLLVNEKTNDPKTKQTLQDNIRRMKEIVKDVNDELQAKIKRDKTVDPLQVLDNDDYPTLSDLEYLNKALEHIEVLLDDAPVAEGVPPDNRRPNPNEMRRTLQDIYVEDIKPFQLDEQVDDFYTIENQPLRDIEQLARYVPLEERLDVWDTEFPEDDACGISQELLVHDDLDVCGVALKPEMSDDADICGVGKVPSDEEDLVVKSEEIPIGDVPDGDSKLKHNLSDIIRKLSAKAITETPSKTQPAESSNLQDANIDDLIRELSKDDFLPSQIISNSDICLTNAQIKKIIRKLEQEEAIRDSPTYECIYSKHTLEDNVLASLTPAQRDKIIKKIEMEKESRAVPEKECIPPSTEIEGTCLADLSNDELQKAIDKLENLQKLHEIEGKPIEKYNLGLSDADLNDLINDLKAVRKERSLSPGCRITDEDIIKTLSTKQLQLLCETFQKKIDSSEPLPSGYDVLQKLTSPQLDTIKNAIVNCFQGGEEMPIPAENKLCQLPDHALIAVYDRLLELEATGNLPRKLCCINQSEISIIIKNVESEIRLRSAQRKLVDNQDVDEDELLNALTPEIIDKMISWVQDVKTDKCGQGTEDKTHRLSEGLQLAGDVLDDVSCSELDDILDILNNLKFTLLSESQPPLASVQQKQRGPKFKESPFLQIKLTLEVPPCKGESKKKPLRDAQDSKNIVCLGSSVEKDSTSIANTRSTKREADESETKIAVPCLCENPASTSKKIDETAKLSPNTSKKKSAIPCTRYMISIKKKT